MYKKLLVGLITIFVVLSVPGFVTAVTDEALQNEATTQQIEPTSAESVSDKTSEKQKARIEEYKSKATERLTSIQEKKLAGVCRVSQQKLEKVQSTTADTVQKRQEKLSSISERLKELSTKLKKASVDTAELDAMVDNLEIKTAEMVTAFGEYQQMLEDSSTVDCVTDPVGFKASIEATRAKRAEIRASSEATKIFIQDSVKTIMEQVKASLAQPATESEE